MVPLAVSVESSARVWSNQQNAIFRWFESGGNGNLVVKARAGTGKTTTIIEAVKRAPEKTILLAAFNKRIAEELTARIGDCPHIEAKTLHAIGFMLVGVLAWGAGGQGAGSRIRPEPESLPRRVCHTRP